MRRYDLFNLELALWRKFEKRNRDCFFHYCSVTACFGTKDHKDRKGIEEKSNGDRMDK